MAWTELLKVEAWSGWTRVQARHHPTDVSVVVTEHCEVDPPFRRCVMWDGGDGVQL